jgi:hypothetical protein
MGIQPTSWQIETSVYPEIHISWLSIIQINNILSSLNIWIQIPSLVVPNLNVNGLCLVYNFFSSSRENKTSFTLLDFQADPRVHPASNAKNTRVYLQRRKIAWQDTDHFTLYSTKCMKKWSLLPIKVYALCSAQKECYFYLHMLIDSWSFKNYPMCIITLNRTRL